MDKSKATPEISFSHPASLLLYALGDEQGGRSAKLRLIKSEIDRSFNSGIDEAITIIMEYQIEGISYLVKKIKERKAGTA